ncbi:HAD family hydrolase [Tenacibaculum amylolyticum]|uniref:HAD family hydrolase n=1 Tax=Tenacibaculum amylolyticum TaxID=104269 RepID=UPI0038931BE1
MNSNKEYKGVIFDLDGTLLNTLGTYTYIMNELLKENNFPVHSEETYGSFIGNGAKNFITKSLPLEVRNEAFIEKLLHEFHTQYEVTYNQHSKVYDGVMKVLLAIQTEGIQLTLLSNKLHHLTQKCAAYFFSEIQFKYVIGQSAKYKKPDPSGVTELSKQLEIPLEELVFIGDTEVDINTAKNATIDSIAVTWGYRTKEDLTALKPNYLAETPKDLLKLLL